LLHEWRDAVPRKNRTADLVGELYELLAELNVRSWDLHHPLAGNRLGTLARFTALLADYESVRRRARPDATAPGEQVGGQESHRRSRGRRVGFPTCSPSPPRSPAPSVAASPSRS
jgi:hypothetical protein